MQKIFLLTLSLLLTACNTKQTSNVTNQKTVAVVLNIFRLPIKDFLFEPWFKPYRMLSRY